MKTAFADAARLIAGCITAAILTGCATTPEESAVKRYEAMELPRETQDIEKLEDLDLQSMASDPRYKDLAVYRIKVLPALSTNQRIYRLHLFMPSGPALWVARDRKTFGKKINEEVVVLSAEETHRLFDVIRTSGVLDASGRCARLSDGNGGSSRLVLDGVMLSFDMTIDGDYRASECSYGLGAPVETVAKAFAELNGDALIEE